VKKKGLSLLSSKRERRGEKSYQKPAWERAHLDGVTEDSAGRSSVVVKGGATQDDLRSQARKGEKGSEKSHPTAFFGGKTNSNSSDEAKKMRKRRVKQTGSSKRGGRRSEEKRSRVSPGKRRKCVGGSMRTEV